MIYNATNLIAEAFDAHGIKYDVVEREDASIIDAGFAIDSGPQVIVHFISKDDDNDVAIRIYGLICKISEARRPAVLEACNTLNGKMRFIKFYLDQDDSINVEADLPVQTADSCLGECCFELFIRIMQILDAEFHVLAEALYLGADAREKQDDALLRLLGELKERAIPMVEE